MEVVVLVSPQPNQAQDDETCPIKVQISPDTSISDLRNQVPHPFTLRSPRLAEPHSEPRALTLAVRFRSLSLPALGCGFDSTRLDSTRPGVGVGAARRGHL